MDIEPITIINNYINIAKFVRQNNKFKKIINHLKLIVDEIPEKIQKN
jgi:hypothetical protein